MDQVSVRKKRSKKFIAMIAVLVLLVVGLGITSAVLYKKYQDVKRNPDTAAQENVQELTNKVSKLISLPEETPTVAVVQDKDKLKDQPFFKDAQNGDKVLIFTAAKQAIIYRESTNKLINVGPISLEQPSTNSSGTAPNTNTNTTPKR